VSLAQITTEQKHGVLQQSARTGGSPPLPRAGDAGPARRRGGTRGRSKRGGRKPGD
jgi:hypothetical protein